jgi:Raf kinase inhibitor-like YbhB/YbcL family protein
MHQKTASLLFCHAILALAVLLGACSRNADQTQPDEEAAMTIQLTSSAFTEGASIPAKYTCDGQDSSPPLKWSDLPQGARSLALVADDPDAPAGTWVHWVIYNIPSTVTELPEGLPTTETISNGAAQGANDFKRLGYGGPCPPRGNPHRYFFKLYALDTELSLKPGATKKELLRAMEGHILAQGQLLGTYKRK